MKLKERELKIKEKQKNKSYPAFTIEEIKTERCKVIKLKDRSSNKMKQNEYPHVIIVGKEGGTERKHKQLHKIGKTICMPQSFMLKFEEITNIYNEEFPIKNIEVDDDLLCDESLSDPLPPRPIHKTKVKNPQKYFGDLPSIEERVASEQDKQAGEMSMIKTKRKSKIDDHAQMTTATTSRGRINKSANDSYVREFESRPKTQQKKISIDVMSLIKNRKKPKSSMSTRFPQKKY